MALTEINIHEHIENEMPLNLKLLVTLEHIYKDVRLQGHAVTKGNFFQNKLAFFMSLMKEKHTLFGYEAEMSQI